MKKKILLFVALLSLLACIFAIGISAEAPAMYVEFDVLLDGNTDYTTAYVQNTSNGNPRVDLTLDFYSDKDFTTKIDKSDIVAMDFSQVVTYGDERGYVDRFTTADASVFPKCEEVKWFSRVFTSAPSKIFNNWTQLKRFDFGCITLVDYNFLTNTGLESVEIPATVTELKNGVFQNCTSLKSVVFKGAVTKMGSNEFSGCTALTSVDLGQVTVIGENMFQNCTSLTSIVIPSSVTEIKANAFQNCTALNSVTYEGTPQVKTIGGGAFQYVPATNLTLPSSLEKISGQKAFAESGIQTVVIPAGCTDLSTYTFNKSNVTSVSFAEGFTGPFAFNTGVFQTCSQLTSVELAEGVTVIGQDCFNGTSIVTFVLPDSVTEIKNSAFANCKKLTTFTINPTSNLTTLGSQVFKDGIELTSFYFPNSLTSIGSGLFIYNNGSLKELVNFENCGVTSIPEGVFSQCSGLKEVKFPYGVTEINGKDLLKWANLDSITLPQTLTTITNSITCNSIGKIIFAAPDGTALPANAPDTTVEYVNYCETYFASAHIEGGTPTYTYVDEDGNVTNVAYTSALKVACPCGRNCGVENVIETIPALFTCQGYSAPEYGNGGMLMGFAINKTAVDAYTKATGKTLSYGLFAGLDTKLGTNEAVSTDGVAQNGAVSVDFTNRGYDIMEIKVVGFETDTHKSARVILGAYVIEVNGEKKTVSYLQSGEIAEGKKYASKSYNDLVPSNS